MTQLAFPQPERPTLPAASTRGYGPGDFREHLKGHVWTLICPGCGAALVEVEYFVYVCEPCGFQATDVDIVEPETLKDLDEYVRLNG